MSQEESPDAPIRMGKTNEPEAAFRSINPALFTFLISVFLITLLSGGLALFALVPSGGEPPPFLVAYGSLSLTWILSVAGIVALSWLASGFAQRGWIQAILCTVVVLATTWLLGLLTLSVLLAGLKH